MAHWSRLAGRWVNLDQLGAVDERPDGGVTILADLTGTAGYMELAGDDAAQVRDYLALAGRPGQRQGEGGATRRKGEGA